MSVKVKRDPDPPMDRCTKILSQVEAVQRPIGDSWFVPAWGRSMCGRPAVEVVGAATLCALHAREAKEA